MYAALPLAQPTSQMAELKAAIAGLELAVQLRESGEMDPVITLLVLKTDSEVVVKGLTERWDKWQSKKFKTKRGPVKNLDLFFKTITLVEKLEKLGVDVLFWQVPKDRIKEAEKLAKMGLPRDI
jgi:ribonuclease HI